MTNASRLRPRSLGTVQCGVLLLCTVFASAAGQADDNQRTSLPKPILDGGTSLEATIRERRSVRRYARKPLSLGDVSQLLWAAQGVTSRDDKRAAPSAGALYPLEVYLVAGSVDSLATGLYRYRPTRHDLVQVASGDLRRQLADAAVGQSWVRNGAAVIVIAGVYSRTEGKYGSRAERYTHMEVGHLAQNVYLQAEARQLGTVFVGAFDDAAIAQILQLPPDQTPLGLMPVGHRH